MSYNFTQEEREAIEKAYEEQLERERLYCESLVGLTRDEATKVNMANGFHTQAYRENDRIHLNMNFRRMNIILSENNVVLSAFKG